MSHYLPYQMYNALRTILPDLPEHAVSLRLDLTGNELPTLQLTLECRRKGDGLDQPPALVEDGMGGTHIPTVTRTFKIVPEDAVVSMPDGRALV